MNRDAKKMQVGRLLNSKPSLAFCKMLVRACRPLVTCVAIIRVTALVGKPPIPYGSTLARWKDGIRLKRPKRGRVHGVADAKPSGSIRTHGGRDADHRVSTGAP